MDKDKQAIIFSNEELNELLVVLNVALHDADVAIDLSRDREELDMYRQHQQTVRKWIHRFSQLIQPAHEQEQGRGRGKETQAKA